MSDEENNMVELKQPAASAEETASAAKTDADENATGVPDLPAMPPRLPEYPACHSPFCVCVHCGALFLDSALLHKINESSLKRNPDAMNEDFWAATIGLETLPNRSREQLRRIAQVRNAICGPNGKPIS